jgi:cyclin-C
MATDFWASSHKYAPFTIPLTLNLDDISRSKRWVIDRATLKQARAEDLQYVDSPEHVDFLNIYFANRRMLPSLSPSIPTHARPPVIAMLGKRLSLRQRVIATATVFFRRFYVKNLYCETDPFLVIAACCYVAAKAEESPVHIKNVVSESRLMFSRTCESLCNISDRVQLNCIEQRRGTASRTSPRITRSSPRWSFIS